MVTVLDKPANYRIKVHGSVPESWIDRLGGMRIVAVSSVHTILEGWLPDQAALKGVLDTLYDLRLRLEEVTCLEPSGVCRSEDFTLFHDPENNLALIMKDGKIYKNIIN